MRLKTITFLLNLLNRLVKDEKQQNKNVVKTICKGHSKTIQVIVLEILTADEPFGTKPIKKYMKYLEFSILMLKIYRSFGMKKKFTKLKEAVSGHQENLPADINIKKIMEKLTTLKVQLETK